MDELYSIRMRASLRGLHISGAERIIKKEEIPDVSAGLIRRAQEHGRGQPDSITVTVDSLAGKDITRFPALPVSSTTVSTAEEGRAEAVRELVKAGVSKSAAVAALTAITLGALSGDCGGMRGAMVIDALSGRRFEPDREHGIRARAVDHDPMSLPALLEELNRRGLNNTHLKEALALATKVANAPSAVAELCISDDPDYVTGYVASKTNGYKRITPLKDTGDPAGGRAFFVDARTFDLGGYINYMREVPVLVTGPFN